MKGRTRAAVIGVAAALMATLARAILFRFVGPAIPFLTFFPAVIVAALWGGTRSATIATLLAIILAPFWMAPSLDALDRVAWLNLFFFLPNKA